MTSIILLGHGGGGRMMHDLLERIVVPAFRNPELEARHDGALLDVPSRIAFTTDSYVVRPHVFPGGDIGRLAVHGTVNDLAMCGAVPRWLSAAFILEEGFPIESFSRVVESMRLAARESGVEIVTGDTKVVDRGRGDGIYVNTAGIGEVAPGLRIGPSAVRPGDAVIVSGDLGRHGLAVLTAREGLGLESSIESDTAPLHGAVAALLREGVEVHCLRDLTRGGLAAALVEISEASRRPITIEEERIPVREDVRAACEVLGLDPLHVANEGRFAAFVPDRDADRALAALRAVAVSAGAVRIGTVEGPAGVSMRTRLGTPRIVDMFSGEQLPRIC